LNAILGLFKFSVEFSDSRAIIAFHTAAAADAVEI
jgi:hypothetical protein